MVSLLQLPGQPAPGAPRMPERRSLHLGEDLLGGTELESPVAEPGCQVIAALRRLAQLQAELLITGSSEGAADACV